MKRRGFIKSMMVAAAIATSPVLYNVARLRPADPFEMVRKRFRFRDQSGAIQVHEVGLSTPSDPRSVFRFKLNDPIAMRADECLDVYYQVKTDAAGIESIIFDGKQVVGLDVTGPA